MGCLVYSSNQSSTKVVITARYALSKMSGYSDVMQIAVHDSSIHIVSRECRYSEIPQTQKNHVAILENIAVTEAQ